MKKKTPIILGLLACVFGTSVTPAVPPAGSTTTQAKFNPPKKYYLALGDSITYGFQLSKVIAGLPASAFDTGYVDRFAERLQQIQPDITTVNYGCPGETTASFIAGPCIWAAAGRELHDDFSGSQLDAALAFLEAHPGEVSPITLTLWGNDLREFQASCAGDPACLVNGAPAAIAQISANLAYIVQRLQDAAPDAEIIVTGAWDSFIWDLEFADLLFQALNTAMAQAVTSERARFADPFPVFNPQGNLQIEIQTLCTLLLLCTAGDSHPSDAGYQSLAAVVFEASDYTRLIGDEAAVTNDSGSPAANNEFFTKREFRRTK